MTPPAYGKMAALTVGAANSNMIDDSPVAGFIAGVTVAGNAVLKLDDGNSFTAVLPIGTTILNVVVLEVVSATATGTYAQLAA